MKLKDIKAGMVVGLRGRPPQRAVVVSTEPYKRAPYWMGGWYEPGNGPHDKRRRVAVAIVDNGGRWLQLQRLSADERRKRTSWRPELVFPQQIVGLWKDVWQAHRAGIRAQTKDRKAEQDRRDRIRDKGRDLKNLVATVTEPTTWYMDMEDDGAVTVDIPTLEKLVERAIATHVTDDSNDELSLLTKCDEETCAVCGLPLRKTPSGLVCANGHGF